MPRHDRVEVFLQPGEYFVGDAGWRIRTLLGSCVSITLWHPARRIGAMSHFVLATRGRQGPREPDARYGDEALELMLRDLAALRVDPAACEAKLFGGGDMFPQRGAAASVQVGQRNGEAARSLLRSRGLRVVSESLFGVGHRQIVFDIGTGHVWLRKAARDPA